METNKKKLVCCNKDYLREICPCYNAGLEKSEDRKRLGIGVGLFIAGAPIILTYIIFQFMDNKNYMLSIFVTYCLVTIIGLLIIKKFKQKKEARHSS